MESLRGPGCGNLLPVANTQQMCGSQGVWEKNGSRVVEGSWREARRYQGSQHACWEPVSSHITPCPQTWQIHQDHYTHTPSHTHTLALTQLFSHRCPQAFHVVKHPTLEMYLFFRKFTVRTVLPSLMPNLKHLTLIPFVLLDTFLVRKFGHFLSFFTRVDPSV